MTIMDEAGKTSLDALLEVLMNKDRRVALQYLRDRSHRAVTTDELVDGMRTGRTSDRTSHQTALVLHHMIIPKLEDVGAVEYDARSEMIRYQGQPHPEALLDCAISVAERPH